MAHEVTVLTAGELRGLVQLDLAAVDVVERAFAALASGTVVMPPILSMAIPEANGEVDVKTAYIPGFDGFAIKVSPGFFDNPKLGLPSLNGLMILFSARTGLVEALLLDNGYLTDVRTAAAGAVAARHLAPSKVETACVIGTGIQARLQIEGGPSGAPVLPRSRLGPRHGEGGSLRRRHRRAAEDYGGGRRGPGPRGGAEPARRHHHPGRASGVQGRVAASRPPHHGDGLGPGGQERDRAGSARRGGPLCLRPGQPVRGSRRAAQRHLCGPVAGRHAAGARRDRHGGAIPAAARTTRSPSATSPARARRTRRLRPPPSPPPARPAPARRS